MSVTISDIFQAITIGNERELRSLLQRGEHSIGVPFRRTTALSFAIYRGHCPSVVALLDHGASVEQRSMDHLQRLETPLISAIRLGHYEIFRALLERGAKLNPRDFYGQTPLWHAVKENRMAFVKELLSRGAPINFKSGIESPLNLVAPYLCYKGRRIIAIELVSAGLDTNLCGENQTKSIVWAMHHADRSIFRLVMEAGATLNKQEAEQIRFPEVWLTTGFFQPKNLYSSPCSLTKLCRLAVRAHLRIARNRDIRPLISNLPLPPTLMNYLLMKAEVKDALG